MKLSCQMPLADCSHENYDLGFVFVLDGEELCKAQRFAGCFK